VGPPRQPPGLTTAAASVAVFLAAATGDAFRPRDVRRALRAVWFVAGGGVLLLGLAQLVDGVLAPDTGWDWARPAVAHHSIGSTLGNANHLGGLLAVLLPVGVTLAVRAGRRERIATAALGVALVVELAVTTSRGAWLGTVAGVVTLALVLRRRLPGQGRRLLRVAAAAVALVAAVVLAFGALGVTKLDPGAVARTGPGTTVDLRRELWATAWRMAADHPVTGVGPDVFGDAFPRYEGERFGRVFGPFTVATSAHDLFLDLLAGLGGVGLAAFLALLALSARRATRAWPALPDGDRLLVGGMVAAEVAYLVQAGFDPPNLALTTLFWALLGMLSAMTGPPATER
jgi:O-antigen ligase